MAKATPVNAADAAPEAPAAGIEKTLPPVSEKAPEVDRAALEAVAEEARAEGKSAMVVGNAVRVDN